MTGIVALDVIIGLVFIYLLYSLLATLIAEIIATNLALRAKNLKEAISRMINDEEKPSRTEKLMDFLNIPVNPKNDAIRSFYNHQEIKYLGQTNSRKPSAIQASSFARVILDLIKSEGAGQTTTEKIRTGLQRLSTG